MDYLLTRRPVNKMASVIVNQCNCANEVQLNNLLEQRAQLKENVTVWIQQSASNKSLRRKNNSYIRSANLDLAKLNKQLKPYDEYHRQSTPKDYDHAFRMIVRKIYGESVFDHIDQQARFYCGIDPKEKISPRISYAKDDLGCSPYSGGNLGVSGDVAQLIKQHSEGL